MPVSVFLNGKSDPAERAPCGIPTAPTRASLLFLPLRKKSLRPSARMRCSLCRHKGAKVGKCSSVWVLVAHTHATAADIHRHRVSARGQRRYNGAKLACSICNHELEIDP